MANHVNGKLILDVGCAGLSGLIHKVILQNNKNATLVGADINWSQIKKLKEEKPSLNLVYCTVEKLPFKRESFDCVYMGELIEHFYFIIPLIEEVNRSLQKGGILCFDTPNVYSMGRIINFSLFGRDDLGDSDHKTFFTPGSLRKMLNHCGFEVLKTTTDRKIDFLRNMELNFFPFKWLGSHLFVVAKKRKSIGCMWDSGREI